jgi:hypothetical protein
MIPDFSVATFRGLNTFIKDLKLSSRKEIPLCAKHGGQYSELQLIQTLVIFFLPAKTPYPACFTGRPVIIGIMGLKHFKS